MAADVSNVALNAQYRFMIVNYLSTSIYIKTDAFFYFNSQIVYMFQFYCGDIIPTKNIKKRGNSTNGTKRRKKYQ